MSELTQAEKRERFIKKASENKAKFDKHLRLKKEVFGDMKPEHLKTIFENGAIEDLFSLKLIEYVDAYNECELEQLDLHSVSNNEACEVVVCPNCKDTLVKQVASTNKNCVSCGTTVKAN